MAVNGKAILFDATKCFACRSCQVACKQWNQLDAEATLPTNRGTYENPPDLSSTCWVKIHFKENVRDDDSFLWTFVRDSCRHCLEAPCKQATENPDSITIDEQTGAVLFQEGTANESFERIRSACPFNVPRQGAEGRLFKCVMCYDRVHDGEIPACAKACPSDAIEFGDRDAILALADARLVQLRANGSPHAALVDRRDVRLLILLGDRESLYTLHEAR